MASPLRLLGPCALALLLPSASQGFLRPVPPRRSVWRHRATSEAGKDLFGDGSAVAFALPVPPAADERQRPTHGDRVALRFNVSLTDGNLIHEHPDVYTFTLGSDPPDGLPAWEKAVPRLCLGQRCRIRAEARRAFGDEGAEPLIPAEEPLVFDLELVGWESPMGSVVGMVPNESDGGMDAAAPIVDVTERSVDEAAAVEAVQSAVAAAANDTGSDEDVLRRLRERIEDAIPGTLYAGENESAEEDDMERIRTELHDPDSEMGRILFADGETSDPKKKRASRPTPPPPEPEAPFEAQGERPPRVLSAEEFEQARRNVSDSFRLEGTYRGNPGEATGQTVYGAEAAPVYQFIEKRTTIDLLVPVPAHTSKDDVDVVIRSKGVGVQLHGEEILAFQPTEGRVRAAESFWTIDEDRFRDEVWLPPLDRRLSSYPGDPAEPPATPPSPQAWWCLNIELTKAPPDEKVWGRVFEAKDEKGKPTPPTPPTPAA